MYYSILIQIILLFILPILLLRFHLIKPKYRFFVFIIVFFAILTIVISQQWSASDLGLRVDNLKSAIIPYGVFTILGIFGIFFYAHRLDRKTTKEWWAYWHFQWGFLILAFLQQFVFQGFLIHQLQVLSINSGFIVIIVGFLYSFMHIIFDSFRAGIPLLIVAGIAFSSLYLLYPNLIIATLSHALLNFFAVLYGFFSKTR